MKGTARQPDIMRNNCGVRSVNESFTLSETALLSKIKPELFERQTRNPRKEQPSKMRRRAVSSADHSGFDGQKMLLKNFNTA